ncbi:MAG: pilus assembly protein PilP [Gammaproteobacteria bacterium]|nr:pilus assembly protein PilP [Gammaproteobacteria bacterium]MCI0591295.1 pilus assembly protein PilP [Gammaproteobacteria bacterium]
MTLNIKDLLSALLGLCLVLTMTAGCVSRDMSDLEDWVEEVKARPGGRLEPLPEIKPYEAYTYQSSGARDPFVPFYEKPLEQIASELASGQNNKYIDEIKNRNREELEQFELDSLRMVGLLEDTNEHWGIVLDPDGTIHRVKVGNYLGRNIGKITNIYEDRIELREIIQDSQGRWTEREAALALVE